MTAPPEVPERPDDGLSDLDKRRALVFGEFADDYERFRPGYPAALVDDVLAYADLGDRAALEVGAGTGKATVAFAARGVRITAIEPDARMAAVLGQRVGSGVSIVVSTFEGYRPEQPFGLLYSAQAWHWTDPRTRWQRATTVVAPGGALALFWNGSRPAEQSVVDAMVAAHRRYAPGLTPNIMPDDFGIDTYDELLDVPGFTDIEHRLYPAQLTLPASTYLAYLATTSAYRVLPEPVQERIFDVVRDALGDEVPLIARTALALARPTP